MNSNSEAKKVSTPADLDAMVAQRAGRIVIASDFKAWPDETGDFYSFVEPDSRGIHACERVFHPGSYRLDVHENLCNLILGGSEVVIELTPDCQQAIRFCEILLATLHDDIEAQKVADPYVHQLMITTDWSVKDGTGPKSLPTPVVIGFTDSNNLNKYSAEKPAVIWSKHWQLAIDPLDALLMRVRQILEGYNQSLKQDDSERRAPLTVDNWVTEAIVQLRQWIDGKCNLPTLAWREFSSDLLPPLPVCIRLDDVPIAWMCERLAQGILERNLRNEWCIQIRAPASLMFELAARSFSNEEIKLQDCWGLPVAFDLAFGNGIVKVRCEGLATPSEPAVGVPAQLTSAPQPASPVKENPDDMLTIQQAAKYAGRSERTIRIWLKKKTTNRKLMLPNTRRTGRKVRIQRGDLDPWRNRDKSV